MSRIGLSVMLFPMLNVKIEILAIKTWRSGSFTEIPKDGNTLTFNCNFVWEIFAT